MKSKINQNIFLVSLKESFDSIKKNKRYFTLLFVTQLAFIIVISAIFMYYAIAIGNNAQAVIQPLQDPAALEPSISAGIFDNADVLLEAYNVMVRNILMFLLLSFLAYVFLNGINWDIANLMVNKDSKFFKYQLMFGLSTIVFAAIAISSTAFFLKFLAYVGNNQLVRLIAFLLFVVITYFSYISFGLIHEYTLKQKKAFLKHTVVLGYKKFGTLSFSYAFMQLIVVLFAGIVYFLVQAPISALLFSLAMFIIAMNWGRIFFLIVVKNVKDKIKN